MSQVNIPNFPNLPDFQREDVASLVLISIAMEEMGLSHILNAEGEKIQWVLGTLPGQTPTPVTPATVDEILEVNESVRDTLEQVVAKNLLLFMKAGRAIRFLEATPGGTGSGGGAPAPAPAPVQP
ncbi:hypothetical protein [Polyangium jinanense]|uniref:Uncharacterized protein n=1 Tax=Polyangium jinanense TaxID=2829994 RepID=A0A9X4ASW8_9BACT|nr:hypothetical protein [Polyangium jinanense]MDC3956043.1 hypothetical protein [Polyangium jinanense]MDC3982926.1 hypothetical protein [Polyangium jinanense]